MGARAKNNAVITFPTPSGTWQDPTHFGLWNHVSNTASTNYLGSSALTGNPSAPESGAVVSFATNALVISISGGELADEGAKEAINGIVDSSIYLSLHTADPGSTGANEFTSSSSPSYGRAVITSSQWTVETF